MTYALRGFRDKKYLTPQRDTRRTQKPEPVLA
jgi:hypothetical protein